MLDRGYVEGRLGDDRQLVAASASLYAAPADRSVFGEGMA